MLLMRLSSRVQYSPASTQSSSFRLLVYALMFWFADKLLKFPRTGDSVDCHHSTRAGYIYATEAIVLALPLTRSGGAHTRLVAYDRRVKIFVDRRTAVACVWPRPRMACLASSNNGDIAFREATLRSRVSSLCGH